MSEKSRVVTAVLPEALALRLDEVAARTERSRSWLVRQALAEWLAEEERRYQLTLEALKSVDEGCTVSQEQIEAWVEERKGGRRQRTIRQ